MPTNAGIHGSRRHGPPDQVGGDKVKKAWTPDLVGGDRVKKAWTLGQVGGDKTSGLHALKDGRNALTATNAHGHQRVAAVYALQLVQGFYGDQRASRTNRMS